MIKSVEDLDVFQKAHKLTIDLYQITKSFPQEEKFELVSQIRRASSSVNANLMEGNYRKSNQEYRQFSVIARGSIGELKYHLLLARDLGYISKEEYLELRKRLDNISKMLTGLIKAL
ncbi:S23 ribosomal protein [Halobacteroides halobius DSM 5150]|uniref:S23 ribosomal protein n=1 Tax=Halobacteroides halobius (strain ATCC 35273 / DSM 5150 / MD-1) TaxID=748449 RepID=L0K9Z5_HALHC|nr:four helix bundle protein [Halobacteroides halobius]AGB42137.1 S23 ribosomal protein [Halobacteroides halobius DSM 5150]